MSHILSVTQAVDVLNGVFDQIGPLFIEGEVSDFRTIHNKWVTFSLKDNDSTIPCFMTIWQLKTQIEDGMLVRVAGQPRIRNKGFFSFVVNQVAPSGEGALKRAFELLKQKLETEGLFATDRKRPLPQFPEHIALITSREAAAYNDFIKVLQERQGGLRISFIHTQVQGGSAPAQIIDALSTANTELQELDAIVLVRGGGSLEDLHAFNDESVVRAVAASRTPIIVGIGHERDISLAELAADVRASTPSNAAELLVRSRTELLANLSHIQTRLTSRIHERVREYEGSITYNIHAMQIRITSTTEQVNRSVTTLLHMRSRFLQESSRYQDWIERFTDRLQSGYKSSLQASSENITHMTRLLQSLSPEHVLRRGYSITRSENGKILSKVSSLSTGDRIVTQLTDGDIESTVQ